MVSELTRDLSSEVSTSETSTAAPRSFSSVTGTLPERLVSVTCGLATTLTCCARLVSAISALLRNGKGAVRIVAPAARDRGERGIAYRLHDAFRRYRLRRDRPTVGLLNRPFVLGGDGKARLHQRSRDLAASGTGRVLQAGAWLGGCVQQVADRGLGEPRQVCRVGEQLR